jgi:hypothetical protein
LGKAPSWTEREKPWGVYVGTPDGTLRTGKRAFRQPNQYTSECRELCNFKEEAYNKLEWFEGWVTGVLQEEAVLNCDETGINIGGRRVWLHNVSSEGYTLYYPQGRSVGFTRPQTGFTFKKRGNL